MDTSEIGKEAGPLGRGSSLDRTGWDNTYARLPERFFARVHPSPVRDPGVVKINAAMCARLGLDAEALAGREGLAILAGNRIAAGSEPIALAYAGHQFGHFVPELGDGRANLLGEAVGVDGLRYDLQLKGSGPTPFSRRGDGRAALGPVLREYLVSEAMAALGVPTTRALAAVTTGEPVWRERALPGAILTRVAASHLRVGSFQYFAARGDVEGTRILADYAIGRHDPDAARSRWPCRGLLEGVVRRHAALVAQWMLVGFVHGVMNTDNSSISGETLDYGPCAFLEEYNPGAVFSSIDQFGRYRFDNQPGIALWNLTRLAEALLPVLAMEQGSREAGIAAANEALAGFAPQFEAAYAAGLRKKLGLATELAGDRELAQDLLDRMAANRADFTLTFRRLCGAAAGAEADADVRALFAAPEAYDGWAAGWRRRLAAEAMPGERRAEAMRKANPACIPRNHRVEQALEAAVERGDFQPFEELLDAVSRPYEERPGMECFAAPAGEGERVLQTFCGT